VIDTGDETPVTTVPPVPAVPSVPGVKLPVGPYSTTYEPIHEVQVNEIEAPLLVIEPAATAVGCEQDGGVQVKFKPLTGRTVDDTVQVLPPVVPPAVVADQLVVVVLP
jgi:hypothetical protein